VTLSFSRILFPTDFSEASAHALAVALEFARRRGAELIFVHTYSVPSYGYPDGMAPLTPDLLDELRAAIDQELQLRVEEARAQGVKATRRSVLGTPQVEIVRLAKELDVDLIIMATHHSGALRHALLGSVAEKVVRRAPCPVLTVGEDAALHELQAPPG
jgi:nucleotide-binding universal stress UspA family protein